MRRKELGETQTSPHVIILSWPPTIDSFTPENTTLEINEGETIQFTHTSSDPDNDTLTYSWPLDSVERATTQNWTYTSDYDDAGIRNVALVVSDGALTDSQQWNVTVLNVNRPPEASNLTISPSNPLTTDDLAANYTYYDADGDPDSGTEIRWYRNGTLQSHLNDTLKVPANQTTKSEEWYFTVKPKDGLDFGNLQTSPTVTIQNSLPTASNLTISPSLPYTTDNLTANYTYTDADGDPESGTEIRWYKNGFLQPEFNDISEIPSSATTIGETWYFTVKPKDGTDLGELQISTAVTVQA